MVAISDSHRHLVLRASSVHDRERWLVLTLAFTAVALYVASLFVPWWSITLFAPQYPKGLTLHVGLRAVTGDVREIDILNHYIGMAALENAAPFERHYAPWGIGLLGFLVLCFTLLPGRRLSWLLLVPAIAFPAMFLADSFYWLYRFGHHLDPRAPLRFKPFTPHLFGVGMIGQFHTDAVPAAGFGLAIASLALLATAVVLRRRVCASCGRRSSCGGVCPSAFVGPGLRGDDDHA
jgi:copper chaperone NosL